MLQPLARQRWNFTTAAHLLNRAGFGGTPAEIETLAALGPEPAVSRFVDYQNVPDPASDPEWAKPDPERGERLRAARMAAPEERQKLQRQEQQTQRQRMMELRRWWLQRMASGPRPLEEKMVLFWHGHFATSMDKVRDAYLMWRQNELFRRLATGNWLRLLVEVGQDPAMLLWLDQAQSRKEHPNENFAREVMELFALGEGHYTEKDITEGARALTGWSYDRMTQKFVERPYWHDEGEKVIFSRRGNFDGEDFLDLIVAQPQAARFITAKLWKFFAGEEPSEELGAALVETFRGAGNSFKPVLRAMFLSEEFYASSVIRNQVKSPVQWLVGSMRMLERELPPPLACFGLTRNLGQDLFTPPNVKGWDGGLSWITTSTLLARYNEAATLVQGDLSMMAGAGLANRPQMNQAMERRLQNVRPRGADVEKLFTEKERSDKEALVAALEKRFLQSKLKPRQEGVLRDYLAEHPELDDDALRNAIRLVMSTPEYQLT
ncbi:MAG TPA: DUF1800 domain-containing protein [Candidatus Binatia bacterium]|jgi:uncharacterized protein (DUF1800 family)|nr:DUF1800 domain-containing protein [Candidatus Binatia bacterium]